MPNGPGAGEGSPPAPQVVDVPQAQKAVGEIQTIAQSLGDRFGLSEMRKADVSSLLTDKGPDKKPGLLKQAKDGKGEPAPWQDNAATRQYLENAQAYAQQQAEEWLQKIATELKIPADTLVETSWEDLVKVAKKAGWPVDREEQLDMLRNAYECTKEKQSSAQEENDLAHEAALVSPTLAEIFPEFAHDLIRLQAKKGDVRAFLIEKANNLKLEARTSDGKVDVAKIALALDMEMAGLQSQLVSIMVEIQKQKGKASPALLAQQTDINEKMKALRSQTASGKIEIIHGEPLTVEIVTVSPDDLKKQPNQIKAFAQIMGLNEDYANYDPVGGIAKLCEKAMADKGAAKELMSRLTHFKDDLGLSDTQLKKIEHLFISPVKELGKTAAKGMSILMALLFLLGWRASKGFGQQQQGAMG